MVAELQSGPCIAMEITHKDPSIEVPVEFRKLCGPMDPVSANENIDIFIQISFHVRSTVRTFEFIIFFFFSSPQDIARQVRPETLRAKYGKTKIQNAIHCSDLPEDGLLEVEYFFKILAEG